jgi:hypothetical protein
MKIALSTLFFLISYASQASGQDFSSEEQAIVAQMSALSASMQENGSGGSGYALILAPEYTRWTTGSETISDRETWLRGIHDWFNGGWRVADSKNNILEITVHGEFAFVRRIATETYAGPNGEDQIFQSGVVEVWVKKDDQWLLLQASISPEQLK